MNRAERYVVDCAISYVETLTGYEVTSDEDRMLRNAVRELAQYRRKNLEDKKPKPRGRR